jgi:hypothetical protein
MFKSIWIFISNFLSDSAKNTTSDTKTVFLRLVKSEKPQFTGVNEAFSDEHYAENGVFA